jgi:hypothetical protein
MEPKQPILGTSEILQINENRRVYCIPLKKQKTLEEPVLGVEFPKDIWKIILQTKHEQAIEEALPKWHVQHRKAFSLVFMELLRKTESISSFLEIESFGSGLFHHRFAHDGSWRIDPFGAHILMGLKWKKKTISFNETRCIVVTEASRGEVDHFLDVGWDVLGKLLEAKSKSIFANYNAENATGFFI